MRALDPPPFHNPADLLTAGQDFARPRAFSQSLHTGPGGSEPKDTASVKGIFPQSEKSGLIDLFTM